MSRTPRHHGIAIVYASVFMVALMAIISLAVDWGRVQTAKTEMRNAVDAAARYASAGLADGTYLLKAQQAAVQNKVDGLNLALLAADVEVGTWNTTTQAFVLNGTPRNTVRVTGQRVASRDNAVPLLFGRIIGANSVDVTARSIARQSSLAAVGVDSLVLSGAAAVRRKSTEGGGGVTVASNGTYSMAAGTSIAGDALHYAAAPTGTVSGNKTALPAPFAYAVSTVPAGATSYSSIAINSGNQPVMGSVYVTGNVYVGGSAIITLYGDTHFYCNGNTTFTGNVSIVSNGYRLYAHSVGSGTVAFSNALPITIGVYAPNSAVTVTGAGITGSVVGRSLNLGTTLDYVAAYAIPAKATGGGEAMTIGGVRTVK